jgi:hypothetical protein
MYVRRMCQASRDSDAATDDASRLVGGSKQAEKGAAMGATQVGSTIDSTVSAIIEDTSKNSCLTWL